MTGLGEAELVGEVEAETELEITLERGEARVSWPCCGTETMASSAKDKADICRSGSAALVAGDQQPLSRRDCEGRAKRSEAVPGKRSKLGTSSTMSGWEKGCTERDIGDGVLPKNGE